MTIKFGEVMLGNKAKENILDCIRRNHVTMGPMCRELEDKWAKKFGYKSVKAVNSGTSACMAALMALYELGARPGDEVICPALSFIASANAIRAAGFIPIFCDIKIETLVIDETQIENLITDKTVAILSVNLMGNCPRLDIIKEIADKRNLKLIIDGCESHGIKYQGKYMSEWGDFVCYSCFAAHIIFSVEFGLVGCKNQYYGELIESIRSHGRPIGSSFFNHQIFGMNFKPSDLHASVGLDSFDNFDWIFETRLKNYNYFKDRFSKLSDKYYFMETYDDTHMSPHAFSLVVKPNSGITITGLQKILSDNGIEWKRNFGSMPEHGCFNYLNIPKGKFPESTYVGNNGIHIGVHQYLLDEDLSFIGNVVESYI